MRIIQRTAAEHTNVINLRLHNRMSIRETASLCGISATVILKERGEMMKDTAYERGTHAAGLFKKLTKTIR